MDPKILTEGGLKTLLSKHKLKDNGLQKALATYDKLDDDAHDDCLETITQIGKLAATLKKAKDVAANKSVADYLDDLMDAFDTEEKDVTKAKAASAKTDAADQKKKEKEEKEKEDEEDDDEDEEEEEGEYADRLLTAFKKLRSMAGQPMKYVVCEARPFCGLMIGRRISPKHKQELTELTGGSKKFLKIGECHFEDGTYIFTSEQSVPGLARRLQKSVKNHTGKKFKFAHGGETVAEDDEAEDLPPSEAEARKPAAPGEAPAPEPTAPPTAQQMEALEDRRRAFKKARAAWVMVKTQAEEDLEKVKDGAHEHYLADPAQFPKVVQGCKDIDAIMDNLDDELRDTLDKYASTPLKNQAKLRELGTAASEILDRYCKYVEGNPLMKAIDMKEFADVTIHAPVMKALTDLRKALS